MNNTRHASMNRGTPLRWLARLSGLVIDSANSIIYDEAGNRLHTAKGLLTLLMGGAA